LNMEWDKMSKSKLNGVDPTEVVERHGIEIVRLTMLANVGPHRARKWQENDGEDFVDSVPSGLAEVKNKKLTDEEYTRVKPTQGPIPLFCGRPKLHKPDVPLQPIVASTTAPNYNLAKYLFQLLRLFLPANQNNAKSPTTFLERIKGLTIEPDEVMVSFDVTSQFTNISKQMAIEMMRGVIAWQSKLLRLGRNLVEWARDQITNDDDDGGGGEGWQLLIGPAQDPLWSEGSDGSSPNFRQTHEHTVRLVNFYYDETFVLSAAIARLQETTESLRKAAVSAGGPGPRSFIYFRTFSDLIVMLTPLAPVLSCELWSNLQLACQMQPPSAILHSQLSRLHTSQSDWTLHWPYDLTKSVLDQPFPVISDSVGDADIKIGDKENKRGEGEKS
uniref:leucine--tRNA ligase n=1 Tax=Echinostoma caproni TaxID=27848 RepID=A0A183ADL0_9TREM